MNGENAIKVSLLCSQLHLLGNHIYPRVHHLLSDELIVLLACRLVCFADHFYNYIG